MKKLLTSLLIATALSFTFACGATERAPQSVSLIHPSSSSMLSATESEQSSTETSAETSSSITSEDDTSSDITGSESVNSSLEGTSSLESASSSLYSSSSENAQLPPSSSQELSSSSTEISSESLSSSSLSVENTTSSISTTTSSTISTSSSLTSSSSPTVDYGTLTIANLTVGYNQTATINPIFSTTAGESAIHYSYDTTKIIINGNLVYGLVENEVVEVTATTAYHTTTFFVTVSANYGTLTIDSISVGHNKTATISPVFSNTAYQSEITYDYDTSKISISENTVTGIVAGAVVTVTATTAYHSTSFTVTVGEAYATGISVSGYTPSFTNGTAFSTGNLVVTATYSDNSTKTLTSSEYAVDSSNYQQFVAGTYTISVSALGFTKTYEVTVGEVFATEISISGYTTSFANGTAFSTGNLVVTASYSNNTTKNLTTSEYTVDSSAYKQFVAGSYTITVTALGFTKTYTVTVGEVFATGISISGYTTSFNNGTAFSTGNLVVTASYSNNTTKNLTTSEYTVDSSAYKQYTAGNYTITVTALGFSKTYTATVGSPYATGISISGYTTSFVNDAAFSKGNLVVKASMSDTTTKTLTSSEYTVDSSAYKQYTAGTYAIKVTALGFTKSYNVTVGSPYAKSITASGAKTSFNYGEAFSTGSLVVKATMSDKSTKTLSSSEYSVNSSSYKATTSGDYTITVSYGSVSTTYSVTVLPDRGTLTIANVSVAYQGTATISPKFSTTGGQSTITYTYDTSKISISGTTVTGNVAGAVVTVTAKSSYHTTTFTVTVGADYTFNVANVTTYKDFYVIPTPTFTVSGNTQSVTYSTSSSNVTISGNKITGAVAGSSATVTATSAMGTTATFTVTVGSDDYFKSVFNSSFLPYFSTVQTNLTNKTGYNSSDLTLYIGDSFFDYRNYFTEAFNSMYTGANAASWGISSSLAKQWVWFIQKAYSYNPTKIVAHVGTNDIWDTYGPNGSNILASASTDSANYNTIVNNITALLKELFNNIHTNLPDTKVYWFSIEPRLYSDAANGNAIATAINSNIESFANSNSSWLTYMDSNSIFTADTSLYCDEVHPNLTGYIKMHELLPSSAVSSYTSYQGTQSDFTHTNSSFAKSTAIKGTYGDFVYTTDITINSTTTSNSHITLNFNHNSSYRFLLWDDQYNNKFWYGGIFNESTINSSGGKNYIDATYLPITFKLAVLSRSNKQYLFINDTLAVTYNNSYFPRVLTVGAEGCGVTFTSNTVAHSGTSLYSTYANKVSSLSPSSGLSVQTASNISNSPSSTVGTITTALTDTAASHSETIVSTAQTFLFTGKLTINNMNAGANSHVSLSVGTDHDTSHRFLIWDFDGNGSYYFGWEPSYTSSSQGYFNYTAGMSLDIAVLSSSKNAYLFVNGALQTVFIGKGNCTLLYATENMQTTLSGGAIFNSSSTLYTTYLSAVSSYESRTDAAGTAIDATGSIYVNNKIANFSQSSGNSVTDGNFITSSSAYFLFDSYVTINSRSSNAHISVSFDGTSSNRFLVWDNDSDGTFNYGGAYNGSHVIGSGGSSATTFYLSVLVEGNRAYLFIDGTLKSVLVLDFTIYGIDVGAENCSVSFNSNKLCTSIHDAHIYNAYKAVSGVSNYASSGVGFYDHTNSGNKLA